MPPMSVPERRRRIVIVGAGQTGRALVRMLSSAWEVGVLDLDAVKLDRLRAEAPDRPMTLLAKDGTSLMNLREAGIDGAEWIAALTDRDEVNLEVCRVALAIDHPPAAIGIVRQPESVNKLRAVGAEALTRPGAIAGLLSNQIQSGQQVAVAVGLGRGEILEIPVLAGSPAANARVADLHAGRWLIAAIYRGEEILIPHGDAVIHPGDRLLLTGEPDILPQVGDYLRTGVSRFPLQFGTRLLAIAETRLTDLYRSEIEYFAAHTRGKAVRVLSPITVPQPELEIPNLRVESETYDEAERPAQRVLREIAALDCGAVILAKRQPGWLERLGLARPAFAKLLDGLSCPLLIAAGTHPYRRLVLPVTDDPSSLLAAELAIDLARQLDIPITAFTVTAPIFVTGEEAVHRQKEALGKVADMAALYHLRIERTQAKGNPVREICKRTGPGDLLVVAHRAHRRASFFDPDTSLLLANGCPCSVLVLSYRERVLGSV
jgi:Trk K+ transport system NAD-binding subunit/nucleotide-binding universal stress UspA family protein